MMSKSDKILTVGWIGLFAGVWLILSALFMSAGFMSSMFFVGVLITLFSIIEISSVRSSMWINWVSGLLGVWLIVSPFVFAAMTSKVLLNSFVVGAILVIAAIWAGTASSTMGHGHPRMG